MVGEYERALREAHQKRRAGFYPGPAIPVARAPSRRRVRVAEVAQGIILMEMSDIPTPYVATVHAVALPPAGVIYKPGDEIGVPAIIYPVIEYSIEPAKPKRKTIDVLRETAAESKFQMAEIIGDRRNKALVECRHRAIWRMAVAFPHLSLPSLGRSFGDRDHTTILHAIRNHDKKLRADGQAAYVSELMIWAGMSLHAAAEVWEVGLHLYRNRKSDK